MENWRKETEEANREKERGIEKTIRARVQVRTVWRLPRRLPALHFSPGARRAVHDDTFLDCVRDGDAPGLAA